MVRGVPVCVALNLKYGGWISQSIEMLKVHFKKRRKRNKRVLVLSHRQREGNLAGQHLHSH